MSGVLLSKKWDSCGEDFQLHHYPGERTLRLSRSGTNRFSLIEKDPDGDEPSIYALDGIEIEETRDRTDR